jgi:hypothetical protein
MSVEAPEPHPPAAGALIDARKIISKTPADVKNKKRT